MSKALTDLLAKIEVGTWNPYETPCPKEPDGLEELVLRSYNGSLDAAKALHEAVLSKWGYSYYSDDGHFIVGHPTDVNIYEETHNPCQARAWLIAILKALIAKDQTND